MKKGFRFRVTYRVRETGAPRHRLVEFQYPTLAKAKANYKAILLEFYRKKNTKDFEICLNRAGDPSWENPIFYDSE